VVGCEQENKKNCDRSKVLMNFGDDDDDDDDDGNRSCILVYSFIHL
jgi:hypothetical protein